MPLILLSIILLVIVAHGNVAASAEAHGIETRAICTNIESHKDRSVMSSTTNPTSGHTGDYDVMLSRPELSELIEMADTVTGYCQSCDCANQTCYETCAKCR